MWGGWQTTKASVSVWAFTRNNICIYNFLNSMLLKPQSELSAHGQPIQKETQYCDCLDRGNRWCQGLKCFGQHTDKPLYGTQPAVSQCNSAHWPYGTHSRNVGTWWEMELEDRPTVRHLI